MAYPPDAHDELSPLETAQEQSGITNQEENNSSQDNTPVNENNLQEIEMQKYTTLELPIQIESGGTKGIPLPSFSLSLKEVTVNGNSRYADQEITESFNANEKFDYLEITLTIGGDDPRLKAIDVYTQYAGINTLLIKHSCKFVYPAGMAFYRMYSEWDDLEDRKLEVQESVATVLRRPPGYIAASGLRAKSWPIEGSPNSEVVIGMCKGNESINDEEKYFYGKSDEDAILSVDLGHTLEFDPSNMASGCAINSNNPLTSYTYIWRDYHPIPLSAYNVWGYINDDLGRGLSDPLQTPYFLCAATYRPEWLKAGKIINRSGTGPYNYIVRCITSFDGGRYNWENIFVTGILMKYNLGRWVLLSKSRSGPWNIIPSSSYYWMNAVDFLRDLGDE